MKVKTLRDFDLNEKKVLLRVDLNCDVEGKKIIPSERIKEASKTIKFLKNKKARVVVISHQGNPGKKDFISLIQHAKFLNKFVKVKFVNDVCGERAVSKIKKLKSGEVLVLENVRKVKDEFKPSKKNNILLKNLAPLFDIYVNDAFSVSHRNHTSVTGFAKEISGCIGLLVEDELKALEKIKLRNCLYVLGGAKPESNMKLLGKNKVLATGLFDQLCHISFGRNLGYQNKVLMEIGLFNEGFEKTKRKLKRKLKNVLVSVDLAIDRNGKREEHPLKNFPMDYRIKDIGERTISKYIWEIKKAKAVYMKGPVGIAIEKNFSKGTVELLKAISNCRGFTIIGGGYLNDMIKKYKISKKKFNHVSLSGGALSNYLAGEKLPGLKVLGYYGK